MQLTGDSTILVPVDVSADERPDRDVLELISPVDVVLLGYYPVPDQAAPAQLKDEHEDDAQERLDVLAEEFDAAGSEVETVLVFTGDREATIDRIAEEHACDAVLTAGETDGVDRILVALRGDANLERIVSLVGDLLRASPATVTFFHSVDEDADRSTGEFILRGAGDRLAEDGIDRDRIDWHLSEEGNPGSEIVALASEYDVVVLGETKPSLRDRILGDVPRGIIDETDSPAIVVRDVERE